MTVERVADAIGQTEYPDHPGHPDEVDRPLRLAQAQALLDSGAVVDVDDLLFEPQKQTWHALAPLLRPLGWRPIIVYVAGECAPTWVPPGATAEHVDDRRTEHVVVDWSNDTPGWVICYPAQADANDDNDPGLYFETPKDLLTWLTLR